MAEIETGPDDLIMKARCRLLVCEPWYGTMASLMDWHKSDETKTMGVRLRKGRVECLWNPKFVELVGDVDRLMSVVQHEIEHVVRMHIARYGSRDPQISNVAADMCVNGKESKPNIHNLPMIPIFDESGAKTGEAPPIYLPEQVVGLPQHPSFEEVYEWLTKNSKKLVKGQGQGQGQGQKQLVDRQTVDDHDLWSSSDASEDEARQVIKDMVDQATRRVGSAPGHLTDAIKALQKSKINWRYVLRQFCGRVLGGKRTTYARRNRRYDRFGVPGNSNHASIPLMIGVDVSGSIAADERVLRQFFTEIEAMSHQFKISLVLWDVKIQMPATKYRRGDWRKIKALGGGGTYPNCFFEYLEKEKLINQPIIVLTDGEFGSWPEPPSVPVPVLWCVSTDCKVPWGKAIRIKY